MPYKKDAQGKWIAGTMKLKDGSVAMQKRLLLVDNQIDEKGFFKLAALGNVAIVEFNSAKDGLNFVLDKVRMFASYPHVKIIGGYTYSKAYRPELSPWSTH